MELFLLLTIPGALTVYLLFKIFNILKVFKTLQTTTTYSGEIDPQERWSKTKIPPKVDVVIIGSGMSGLCAAAFYSKIGKKVLVLEQHYIAGGCIHSFKEAGYEFDSGFHYIGNQKDYMQIWEMAMTKKIDWRVFQEFDKIKLNQEEPYVFTAPKKQFIQNFKDTFPHMIGAIDKYFNISRRAASCSKYKLAILVLTRDNIIRKILMALLKMKYSDVFCKSTKEIMDKTGISKDKRLTALINGQLGDIGVTSDTVDFSDQVTLLNHYTNGSIYPKDGTMEIVKSIMGTILGNGGKVLCRARVSEILTANGRVKGVLVNGETVINAPVVLSSVGLIHTNAIIPQEFALPVTIKDGIGHFYMFVGIKGNSKELNIPSGNMWHYPNLTDYDSQAARHKYLNMSRDELLKQDQLMTFTCFPSVKAEEVQKTDGFSCIVLAEAKSEWVKDFEISDVKRIPEYTKFKEAIQEIMLKSLYNNFPQLKGKVDYINLATPLTNKMYYNRYSSYGLQFDIKRSQEYSQFLNPFTKIEGLYLTGQDIFSPGIAPSIISGLVTFLKATNTL